MKTPAAMISDILNKYTYSYILFHSSPRINQTLHQILHILHFCTLDSLLNYTAEFVVNYNEIREFGGTESGSL